MEERRTRSVSRSVKEGGQIKTDREHRKVDKIDQKHNSDSIDDHTHAPVDAGRVVAHRVVSLANSVL